MIGRLVLGIVVALQPCLVFAWGGDGYLLPFRGSRVASRCAGGYCAPAGTWRRARQSRAMAAYGVVGAGYGSAGTSGYASAGSSGYAATTVQRSYGSYGSTGYAGGAEYVYFSDGTVGRVVETQATQAAQGTCNCENCDCECCQKNKASSAAPKETSDAAKVEFKNGLTSMSKFKSGLSGARLTPLDVRPTEMLAAR